MRENNFMIQLVAKLNHQLTKKSINNDLKSLNNTMFVRVAAKLSKTISHRELNKQLKELNNLTVNVGTKVKIGKDTKEKIQKNIKMLQQSISDLEIGLKSSKKNSDIESVRNQVNALTSELKSNELAAQSTGDKWRKLTDQFKELFSVASVIRTLFTQVKQAVSTTIDLDKIYTDLIKVNSKLNRTDYSEYLSKCNQKAQELATTQKALIEGATEFSKSGYDLSTSDKLTEKSTVLAKVGEMSASDSAKAIISGVQAYDNIDGYTDVIDKAQALIDKYNKIGNTASITTAEIAQGVQEVGSVFADANTSVDHLIALGSAGNRQFQDAESLFLGLRTSALRIRGCTAELEDMGEETDTVVTSTAKLEEKIKRLTNINGNGGVEILKSDGETFRSIYDIFLDISKVYKDMSNTDQSELLELIAGKHRTSAISATLNNMAEAEEILQNSLNAAGSAQKEYNAYLESTEAHIQQFQAKLVETYSTFLNGDIISHVTDLGTGILDLINKTDLLKHTLIAIATIKIGQGISAIGGVIANTTKQMKILGNALQQVKVLPLDGALRNSEIKQIGESTKSLTEKNLKLILSQKQLSEQDKIRILSAHDLNAEQAKEKLEKMGLTNATNANTVANATNATSVNGLKGAFVGLTASVKATWVAMSTLQKASIIFAAISTAWSVVSSVVSSRNESVEEAKEKTKELAKEAIEEEKSLLSLIKRYNELDKTDRSKENTATIKELNEQINDVLDTQAEKIDLVNGRLDEQSDKLRRNLLQKLEDDKTELDTAASIAKSDYEAGLDEGMFGVDPWGSVSRALTENGASGIGNIGFNNVSDILRKTSTDQQIEQIKEWLEFLTKVDGGSGKYGNQLASLQSWYNDLIEKREKYNEAKEAQQKNEAQQKILNDSMSGKINDFSAFENYRDELQKTYSDNSVFRDQMLDFIDNIYPEYAEKVRDTINIVKDSDNTSATIPLSFSKAWDKLGKEPDEDIAKEHEEAKEKLLELAEAGKLTKEEFESSPIAQTIFNDTGLSAEQATQKINNLIEDIKQLKAMESGISAITSAYDEKKNSETNTVSRSTLESMYDTLGVDEWDNKNKEVWKNYKKCAADGKASMGSLKEAQDELATSFVNSNNFLANLDDTSDDYYETLLKQMGVENADTIVKNELAKKKGLEAIETADLTNMTSDEIAKLIEEKAKTDQARNAMKLFALEKVYANGKALDTTEDINQLINLMDSLGLSTNAVKAYRDYLSGKSENSDVLGANAVIETGLKAGAINEINKARKRLKGKAKNGKEKISTAKTKDSSDNSNKDKTKETKTEIDWLSRRLTRMQSIIDHTAAKLQNLFSIKAKSSNLNKQIKQTNTLMKQYSIAAEKYQKKADLVAGGSTSKIKSNKNKGKKKKVKPLSKDIINKIQSGKITKSSYSKLIKEYGQSNADRINKYIDYFDKAQDARKNKQDAKAKIRGLKQEKLQSWVDLYDSRTARAEAKESIQTTAKDKETTINTQIKNTKLSYEYQIKIAKLSKNKAEADRLDYELQQKIRELEQEKLQNYVDEYNACADLAEINSSNAIGYEKQNGFINTQLSYLKQSYAKQIEIAKLSNDKTEQDRLQAEYKAKEVSLKQEQIDNLKTDYENRIGLVNNDKQDISNSLSETEAKGNIVQAGFYSSLNTYEKKVLDNLMDELGKLQAEQNTFDMYSPQWYDLQSDIQSVENSINEANISIIENNKKIGELRQTMYEDIAARNSDVSSEAQFLASLLGDSLTDDKTGNLTKEGLGVLGTYGIELKANTNTAGNFKQEREEIEKAVAAFKSGDAHALDMYGSLTAAEKTLNEVIKKQQEAISAEYESKKNIYDLMVKRYEAQLAYLKSIIDAKKQVLDMEKDLYDYEKNINSQTKNIAMLEKQMASLKGDDSEEGRARRAKLQVSLDEANQNLQDTEYERYISDQQNMLDNMYTQYEDLLTALEKDFETVVKDGINLINTTAGGISNTLNNIASQYNYVTTSDMRSIMNSFNDTGLKKLDEIFNNLAVEIRKLYNGGTGGSGSGNGGNGSSGNGGSGLNGQRGGDTDTNPPGSTPNRDPIIQQGETDADKEAAQKKELKEILSNAPYAKKAKKSPGEYESRLNQILAKKTEYIVTIDDDYSATQFLQALNGNGNGSAKPGENGSYYAKDGNIYKKLKERFPLLGFRTGGIVRADGVPKDGDYVPVRVNPNETILTQDFTKLLPDSVDTMKYFVNATDYAKHMKPKAAGNNFGNIIVTAELPNVSDAQDFVSEFQNSKRIQKAFEIGVRDCLSHGRITNNIQNII